MRKLALLSLFALLLSAFAYGQTLPCNNGPGSPNTFNLPCLFYAGDFNPNDPNANGLANENDAIVGGNPYGAATYQNFVYQGGPILGLFTNNLSQLTPESGYWEIRSGVAEGNGGVLIASGVAVGQNFLQTPTGRGAFGYDEVTDAVLIPPMSLQPSETYWFAVVPLCPNCNGRSFNSNTFGAVGKIGVDVLNQQYFNSPFFAANFTNANNEGVFQEFSSGVLSIPEPSSMIMLGTGLLAAAGVVRRRLF